MAIQTDSYQKINWGWLNDYNGYKFAPITFFEQLYTEEGYSFKDQYDKRWSDLEQGKLVAGAATSLKYPEYIINEDNEQVITGYSLYNTGNKYFPIYFKDGVPEPCDPSLLGNINHLMDDEAKVTLINNINNIMLHYNVSIDKVAAYKVKLESAVSEEERNQIQNRIDTELNNQEDYQNQLRALTTIHGGTIIGDIIIGDNIKFNKPFKFKIGNTAKTVTQSDSITTWTHSDIGFANNSSGLLSTGEQTINGLKKFTSNIRLIDTERGYFLTTKDAKDNLIDYAGIYDNGSNLWIGAMATKSSHHLGATYISAGYDETNKKGNESVYICVPNEENNGGSAHKIIHAGNFETYFNKSISNGYEQDLYLRHAISREDSGIYQDSSERVLAFLDNEGTTKNDRFGAIRSFQSENSGSYYRNYMFMTAYSPKPDSTTYGEFYVFVNNDGGSGDDLPYAEAGVRSAKTKSPTNTTNSYSAGNIVFMGAAWNDYAEFRDQIESIEPGYCVASTDDGKVYKTTEKFQACDGVVSDTYGFAIGRSETYQTPLAVSGRVLAYCEGDRYDYHAGDTVCAGPEGKVYKMTREEIKEYPDRIIGIVSEIPEYEEWTGKKVNNRIWIKVR